MEPAEELTVPPLVGLVRAVLVGVALYLMLEPFVAVFADWMIRRITRRADRRIAEVDKKLEAEIEEMRTHDA